MDVAFSGRSVRSAVCMLFLSGTTALLSLVSGCGGFPHSEALLDSARTRWDSHEKGQVLFIDPVEGTHGDLWTLRLPDRTLQPVPLADSIRSADIGFGAIWGRDSNTVYYNCIDGSSIGLYRLNRRDGMTRLLLETGIWEHPGGSHGRLSVPDESGLLVVYDPPSVAVTVSAFDFAPESSELFVLVHFRINRGPPDWTVDPDSLNLPAWADELVRMRLSQDIREWDDLIVLGSLDQVSWVRELESDMYLTLTSVPDGQTLAWRGLDGVSVLDREKREVVAPLVPEGTILGLCAFSPDGSVLAAVGSNQHGSGVYTCKAPDFAEFKLMHRVHLGWPFGVSSWSPDGEWILIHVAKGGDGYAPRDLIALEVATGQEVPIPRPYLRNGQPARGIFVHYTMDWTR